MNPPPSTPTQLISAFTELHPPHAAHFSLHPAFCNTLDVIRTKILHAIGQFPQTLAAKFKVVHFNWKSVHIVYWRYRFRIRTFDSKIRFWPNLGRKSQSCPFFLKIETHDISTMLILITILVFWISNHKFFFGQTSDEKFKVVRFGWKLSQMISRACWFSFQH